MKALRRRSVILLVSCLLLAGPAVAGVYFEAETVTEAAQGQGGVNMVIKSWVEGLNGKVEFEESVGNPIMTTGSYLLTHDGGKTVYLVKPEEGTYAVIDLEGMIGSVNDTLGSAGGVVNMKFTDPTFEKLDEGPGEEMLGFETRHHQWKSGFTMQIKVMGFKQESRTDTQYETWVAPDLDDAGFGLWLRNRPPSTGDDSFDTVLKSQWQGAEHFALKTIAVTTTTDGQGNQQTSTSTTRVTRLEEQNIADSVFELDPSLQETTLMSTMQTEGGDDEAESPLKGLFGRKKKN